MNRRAGRLSRARAERWRRRWDLQQNRYLGDRERRFEAVLLTVEVLVGRRPRVLDLGCGTGSLSERLLARCPGARVVAVDYDPVTLTLGRTALGSARGRLAWVEANLNDPAWTRALPAGRFDAAVSSTALHWLEPRALRRLYRQLAPRIRPGGVFVNADLAEFDPTSRRLRAAARAIRHRGFLDRAGTGESWNAWWRAVARDPALAAAMAEHRRRFPRSHSGTPALPLAGQRLALRRAGFHEVESVRSWWENTVLAAVR
jgi:SAM-dependent methyltransferase